MLSTDIFKIGPVIAGITISIAVSLVVNSTGVGNAAAITAGVSALCAVWWMLEAIPLPVTALVPLAVFPLTGVLTPDQVASAYGSPIILLFLGGFIMSAAMERSGAHRRLALNIVAAIGGESPRRLVIGFMAATALLSMFISNTAAVLMMLPIIVATVEGAESKKLTPTLFLAVGYTASIAGIGTPIGSPPNLLFIQAYRDVSGVDMGFASWMVITLPIVFVMLAIAAVWLTRNLKPGHRIRIPPTGPWTAAQARTIATFACVAILWITRSEPFGGWSDLLGMPNASDATVALLGVIVMFLVPNGVGGRLLDWQCAEKIPWGTLLIFAGGITIARAFSSSGLGDLVGTSVSALGALPLPILLVVLCLCITFLTELTSNTATAALLMPVLASAAIAANLDPLVLMLPAAITVSFAFMLPVATPPNAVIYGSGKVSVRQMVREGLVLNLAGVVVISLYFAFVR